MTIIHRAGSFIRFISVEWLNLSNAFLQSLTTKFSKKTSVIALAIFVASLMFFRLNTTDALINGDSAVYLHQIQSGDFALRTVHIGYYLLMYGISYIFPLKSDLLYNSTNNFFGALSAAVIFLITYKISNNLYASVFSSMVFTTSYYFIENSVYAEVSISQVLFIVLALLFWLSKRSVLAGISFAISFLVTTSSLLALPLFVLLISNKRQILSFFVTFLVIVILVLAPNFNDYIFGGRGMITHVGERMLVSNMILKEAFEVYYGFFLFLPLIIFGTIAIFRIKELRCWGIAFFSLWLGTFVLVEISADVIVQLPTYALLCINAGLGLHLLLTRSIPKIIIAGVLIFCMIFGSLLLFLYSAKIILPFFFQPSLRLILIFLLVNLVLLAFLYIYQKDIPKFPLKHTTLLLFISILAFNSLISVFRIQRSNTDKLAYKQATIEIQKIVKSNYLVIGDWHPGILFNYYVYDTDYSDKWLDHEWFPGKPHEEFQEQARQRFSEAVNSGSDIILLENYPDMIMALQEAGYSIAPYKTIYHAVKNQAP